MQYVALTIFFYFFSWHLMGVFHFERILYCPRLFLSINIFSMEPFFGGFSILFHFSEYSIYFWGWFDSISLMYKMLLLWWCSETFFSDKKEQLHFKEFRCGNPKANFHVQCGHFCGFFFSHKIYFWEYKILYSKFNCTKNMIYINRQASKRAGNRLILFNYV